MNKIFKYLLLSIPVLAILGILFVKFDTPAAAQFTDNVLRPLLGNTFVGFLEKSYYNTADKIQQTFDKSGIKSAPEFLDQGLQSSLAPIKTLGGLPFIRSEGVWLNRPLSLFPGKEVMAYTFCPTGSDPSLCIRNTCANRYEGHELGCYCRNNAARRPYR